MSDQKITTTRQENLRPLGSPGQRSFELISSTVRDRLGDRHAALFAEPVPTGAGDHVDWYASVSGDAVLLTSLDEGQQSVVRDDLESLVGDVRELSDTLRASASGDDQRLGEALAFAVEIPSEDNIYAVSNGDTMQPILLNWAHLQDVVNPAMGVLAGTVKRAAPPVAPPVSPEVVVVQETIAPQRRFGWAFWLAWLLVIALILWILWLLLQACGLTALGIRPAWLNHCPQPTIISQSDEERTQEALLDRLHRLEQELADLDRGCEPVPPEPEPEPEPLPEPQPEPEPAPVEEPEDDIDARLDREDAQDGDLTFALAWDDRADLDMHITCPNGNTINYQNKSVVSCRGTLDVDANDSTRNATTDPVEHVVINDPLEGTYKVLVRLFRNRGQDHHPFRLRIQIGSQTRNLEGSVSTGRKSWTTTFQYPE